MRYLVVSNQIEGELSRDSIEYAGVIASYSTEIDPSNPRKAFHYAKDASRFHRRSCVVHQKSENHFEVVKS